MSGESAESVRCLYPPELTPPPAAPAVTLVEVWRLLGEDFLVEIEAIAAAGSTR